MANAFQVLGNMQRLAAALTEAGRRGGFPPGEAACLTATASGLWKSRRILETALDSAETRRRALTIVPPVSAAASAPTGVVASSTEAPADAVGTLEASLLLGVPRGAMIERAKRLGLVVWVPGGSRGEFRIRKSDLEKLRPRPRAAA